MTHWGLRWRGMSSRNIARGCRLKTIGSRRRCNQVLSSTPAASNRLGAGHLWSCRGKIVLDQHARELGNAGAVIGNDKSAFALTVGSALPTATAHPQSLRN